VAKELSIPRCLIALDESIDPEHSKNADREDVVLELRYSQMASLLDMSARSALTTAVDVALLEKNQGRMAQGQPPLASYYRDYALLQEVTKAASKKQCAGLTVAHTMRVSEIRPSSVTSFFTVGLAQGLYDTGDLVAFPLEESEHITSDEPPCTTAASAADATEATAARHTPPPLPPSPSSVAEEAPEKALCPDAIRLDISLEEALLVADGSAAAKEAARRAAVGHAQWLLAHWTASQQRRHPEVSFQLVEGSKVRITIAGGASGSVDATVVQAADEQWRKAVASALKKIDVEDLGDMSAPSLLSTIPDEDAAGRGMRDLRKIEKELSVTVVFGDDGHLLLVGAMPKLTKKCFVLRNLLSHYHWRLSGRDVAFEEMTAK